MSIQRVWSKWAKTKVLLADPDLKKFVPDTRPFSKSTLAEMLERLGMVYVKPVHGTFGMGVIRVERHFSSEWPYLFQSGVKKYRCRSFEEMFRKLSRVKQRKKYLVQQGIEMLRYANRRFDVRIMVQMNPQNAWVATGLIGRLAHPRKIVTNYHSGGTPMPVEDLLGPHLTRESIAIFRSALERLGILTAEAMQRKYPGLKEIGLDVAIDKHFTPWILEVNTRPDPFIFRKLPDRSVFQQIYRYAVQYGRFRPKTRRV